MRQFYLKKYLAEVEPWLPTGRNLRPVYLLWVVPNQLVGWQVERSNTASSLGERVSNHHPLTETVTGKANIKKLNCC
jgi:hypothetical protein